MNTKKLIEDAMFDLLTSNTIEDISVEMITQKSGVSRTTFYRYFKDKYDLMNYHFDNYFINNSDMKGDMGWREFSYEILTYINDNRQYYKNAFKSPGQNSGTQYIYKYTIENVSRVYKVNSKRKKLSYEEKSAIIFYSAGSLQIVKNWIINDDNHTPRQVSDIILDIMPQTLKEVLL